MIRPTWFVLPVGGRGTLPAVEVTGPAIDELLVAFAEAIADAAHGGDGLHPSWDAYAVARFNLNMARELGVTGEDLDRLDDAAQDAWDTVAGDLPRAVRLGMAEARMVAGALDEAAGRIGVRGQ